MGFLSDRTLRVAASVVALSGWIVALIVVGKGAGARPAGISPIAAASTLRQPDPTPAPLRMPSPVSVRPANSQLHQSSASAPPGIKPSVSRPAVAAAAPRPQPITSPASTNPRPQPSPPAAVAATIPAAEQSGAIVVLVGITSVNNRDSAWLLDPATGEKLVASVGDMAFGYQVKAIGKDMVTLTREGRDSEVRLGSVKVQSLATHPATEPGSNRVSAAAPSTAGVSVYNPVTVNTYVNVYPPESSDDSADRYEARSMRRPADSFPQPVTPIIVINNNRGRSSQPYWNKRSYRSVLPGVTRRSSVRVTGPQDDAQLVPDPIVNPQTLRRMSLTGSAAIGGYPQPHTYSNSSRYQAFHTDKWLSTRPFRR